MPTDDQTLYVVGGFKRNGTSMMMQALSRGGLTPKFDPGRADRLNEQYGDEHYKPNKAYYELSREEYQRDDFPKGYEGKLIKCLDHGPKDFCVMDHGIRAVIMRRPLQAINRSHLAFFGREVPRFDANTEFQIYMERMIKRIKNRKDFLSVHTYWFSDVVYGRESPFIDLAEAGWPIDPYKAREIIDTDKDRHGGKNEHNQAS